MIDVNKIRYSDKIVEDGEVKVASIFQFKGGCEELFPFLYACQRLRCAVFFENENIYISKNGSTVEEDVLLSLYGCMAQEPKICVNYINYLGKGMLNQLNLDKPDISPYEGQHEPILKD